MSADEIKARVDLAAFLRADGLELASAGADTLRCVCPFHPDTDPSLVVTPSKQLWHCLGCDKGGSVIDYVMHRDNVDAKAAIASLRGQVSGVGCQQSRAKAGEPPALPVERAAKLLERAASLYEQNFAESATATAYLAGRGLTDLELLRMHRVGFCNGTLTEILPSNGPVRDELRALGVLLGNGRERFANCIVIPIVDADGGIRTLYGREIHPRSEIRDPKSHRFLPGRPKGLFNVAAAQNATELIVVEGVLDAFAAMTAGFPNVVALNGKALRAADAAVLQACGVRKLCLLLDGDKPGREAAARLKEELSVTFRCEVRNLPDGQDPASLLAAHGPDALGQFLAAPVVRGPLSVAGNPADVSTGAPPAPRTTDHGQLTISCGPRTYHLLGIEKSARKLRATLRIEHAGKLHVDTVDFYSARARRSLVGDLARVFELGPDQAEADVARMLQAAEDHKSDIRDPKSEIPAMTAAERAEAEAFGRAPDLVQRILADFETCGLVGERHNKLLGYLAAVSRKMDQPLSVLILSSSGAGKTALQDAALRFCPPEDVVKLTNLSEKALFYKEEFSLKHKVLAIEEGDGAEGASYAIRNLISAGELTSETAMRDPTSGKLVTQGNRVEGPTAVFVTTTDPEVDAETKSRFLVTHVDESPDQTRAILAFQRRRRAPAQVGCRARIDDILRVHRNFQRLLQHLAVVNPYAEHLAYGDDRLQGRRDQPKYLNLIDAVAFLRQLAKPVKTGQLDGAEVRYVEVDETDLRIAHDLAHVILGRSLDEVSYPARQLYRQLDDLVDARLAAVAEDGEDDPAPRRRQSIRFTRRQIMEATGWNKVRVHRYLKELVEIEYVAVEGSRAPFAYRLLAAERQDDRAGRFVPGLKDVDQILADHAAAQRRT